MIVTNTSFCIDHRLLQVAFLCSPKWAKAGQRLSRYVEIKKKAFRYYIKQTDSMLLWVCSVIDHRRRQNVVRTSVTHSARPCGVPLFKSVFVSFLNFLVMVVCIKLRSCLWKIIHVMIFSHFRSLSIRKRP